MCQRADFAEGLGVALGWRRVTHKVAQGRAAR